MTNHAQFSNIISKFENILLKVQKQDQDFLNVLSPLLKRFQGLLDDEEKRLRESFVLVKSFLPILLTSFDTVLIKTTIKSKKEAPDYNIFQVLKLERKEVGTHSVFLSNLLDPNGFHGQGSIFLDRFLEKIEVKEVKPASGKWRVSTEKWAGYADDINDSNLGRMDIVLQNERSAVVIENKIDHYDEPNQLWRYGKWLEKEYGRECLKKREHFRIVYLTPSGRNPTAGSLSPPFQYEGDSFELEINDILKWSYKNNLCEWLRSCLNDIEAPPVKTIIYQYLRTIGGF